MKLGSSSQTYLTQSSQWGQNLTKVYMSALSFGDLDNDGDLDLIETGVGGIGYYISKVYVNNGTSLIEDSIWQQNLTEISYGSLSLGDIDNDGDLDLVMSGCEGQASYVGGCPSTSATLIYINNGTTLTESSQWQSNLTGVYRSALTFGDIDNDGDLDLALTGEDSGASRISKVYINNGTTLIESSQWQSNLTGIRQSSLAFMDYDNDNDLDLILSGVDTSNNKLTKTYLNNATSLVESSQWESNLVNVGDSSITFADYDNDGDLDLSLAGCCDIHRLYRNNETAFIEINRENTGGLDGFFAGSASFGDYDNDGYLDLITSGREDGTFLHLYNISANNFTSYSQDPESHITNIHYSSLAWVDLDNDNDLDLIEVGYGTDVRAFVYISNRSLTKPNTKPSSPNSSFSSSYVNNVLILSWGNGSDTETNISGLYYNLMVGNSTNNHTIVSGVYGGSSNPTAGYFGNMMQRKSIRLNVQLEANKTYYWYVQTIDTGLAKSNWSVAQNFTTTIDVTKPNITINHPSPNESLHTANPYFIFNVTVTDANLTNVTLYADWTGSMIANETNSSGLNGTYILNKNLTGYNDGMYSWYIYACDGTNNCQTSETRNFYLDRGYPIVNLVSPTDESSWTSSSSVTFSYNVTDTNIANCSLIINESIDQTNTTITENTTQTFTKTLSNAVYTWQVNCTDYVGYTNGSANRSLTVSYTATSDTGNTGSSGGGGSSAAEKTYILTDEQFAQGFIKELSVNDKFKFILKNETHYVVLSSITSATATINVFSSVQQAILSAGEEKIFELTGDNYYDLLIKINSIVNSKANLTIKSIYEKAGKISDETEKTGLEKPNNETKEDENKAQEKPGNLKDYIIGGIIFGISGLILILVIFYFIKLKFWRKNGDNQNR